MDADEKMATIKAALAAGKTVYLSTAARHTKLTAAVAAKFEAAGLEVVRVRNGSLELREGRRMVCADYCALTVVVED